MTNLRFDDQVAIVTGAGRGIGAGYASLLADRGAAVMVNDLGVSMFGQGSDSGPAAEHARTIQERGGRAAHDTSDISTPEGAQSLIDHTLETFGRIDIVVNNAGIYWTDEFPSVELSDLRRQLDVHVGGSFNVTKAAWPHLSAQGYGRVVVTTSTGALGAANMTSYGAAKAGVLGLGRALAMAGVPHGIKVNVVAPMAMTRMMAHGSQLPEPTADPDRDTALVAPLVALLCHAQCPSNGETYVSGMRRISRLFLAETRGYVHPDLQLTIEDVLDNWDDINDLSAHNLATDTMSWSDINNGVIGAALTR